MPHQVRRRPMLATLAAVLILVSSRPAVLLPANAAFPGANGRIAFVELGPDPERASPNIYSMNADGTARSRLTNTNDAMEPTYSASGEWIAYQRGGRDIWIMTRTGAYKQRITWHPAADHSPSWSPDGKRLAFVSNRSGIEQIWVYTRATDSVRQVTFRNTGRIGGGWNPAEAGQPAWSPSGRQILFTRTYRNADGYSKTELFTICPDGSGLRRLTYTLMNEQQPAWSPGGGRIAFYAWSGGGKIFTIRADGTGMRQVIASAPGRSIAGGPAWSPDGTKLLVSAFDPDFPYLLTVSPDGTNIRQIGRGWDGDWQPRP